MTKKKRMRAVLANINHYIVAAVIILKGIEKLDHFDYSRFPFAISFFFLAGLIIILGTIFHHAIEKRIKNFHVFFYVIEGLALCIAGLILLENKNAKIPYFLFFTGIIYIIFGIWSFFLLKKNDEKHVRIFKCTIGSIFLAGGLTTFVINKLYVHSLWFDMITVLSIGAGITLIITRGIPLHGKKD